MLAVPSNLIFFQKSVPFRSVPKLELGYSETHGFPRKKHFFPRNNKNHSEPIRGIFSERNFDGNPTIRQLFFQFSKPVIFHSVCLFPANNFRSFHSKSTILGFYPKAKKSFVWNKKINKNLRRLLKRRRRRSKVRRPWQKNIWFGKYKENNWIIFADICLQFYLFFNSCSHVVSYIK